MGDDREAGSSAEKTQGYTKETLGWDRLSNALGRLWSALWGKIFIVAVAFLIIILLFQSYSFVNKRSHQLIKEVPLHCNTSEHYTLAVAYPKKIWIEEKDTPARFIMVSITQPLTAPVTPVTFTLTIHHQEAGIIFSDDKGKPLPAELTLIPNRSKKLYVSHLPLAAPVARIPVSIVVTCNATKNILSSFNLDLESKISAGFRRFFELLLGPSTILLAVVGTLIAMGFKLWEGEEKRRKEMSKRKQEKSAKQAYIKQQRTEQAKIGFVNWSSFIRWSPHLRKTVSVQNQNIQMGKWLNEIGLDFNPFYPERAELDPKMIDYNFYPPLLVKVAPILHGAASVVVFGETGSGKTATARWLSYDCTFPATAPRNPHTLPVYCPLIFPAMSDDDCFLHLTHSVAHTLAAFFAINPYTFIALNFAQKAAIVELLTRSVGTIELLTLRLKQINSDWQLDGKETNTSLVEGISYLAKEMTDMAGKQFSENKPSETVDSLRLLSMAFPLDFNATYLLVDVRLVENHQKILQKAAEYIQTLLNYAADLSSIGIYVKLLLPTQLQSHLHFPAYIPVETITWSDDELKELLNRRVQAAGLDGAKLLFNSREVPNPETTFVKVANGSPRRMLSFGNQLIMRHITQSPTEPQISGKLFYDLAEKFLENEPA